MAFARADTRTKTNQLSLSNISFDTTCNTKEFFANSMLIILNLRTECAKTLVSIQREPWLVQKPSQFRLVRNAKGFPLLTVFKQRANSARLSRSSLPTLSHAETLSVKDLHLVP